MEHQISLSCVKEYFTVLSGNFHLVKNKFATLQRSATNHNKFSCLSFLEAAVAICVLLLYCVMLLKIIYHYPNGVMTHH
jgi:hypothetical protein